MTTGLAENVFWCL